MRHFLNACRNSCDGFLALLHERAFCQELLLLCVALPAAMLKGGLPALLAVLPWGLLVLAAEALNTGIEKTVDLVTSEWKPLAKTAKDAGSFACGAAIAAFIIVCVRTLLF